MGWVSIVPLVVSSRVGVWGILDGVVREDCVGDIEEVNEELTITPSI